MKLHVLAAALAAASLTAAPAFAETRPMTKGPPKTMGDQGTLPTTGTMGGHVPHMGTAEPGEPTDGPVTQKGPQKRMGDEGKLPATNNMSGKVPNMGNGN